MVFLRVAWVLAALILLSGCRSADAKRQQPKHSAVYIEEQLGVIKAHADILYKEGRLPYDFEEAFLILGQYGWHSACGDVIGVRSINCNGGGFGAYTFYQPAFEQAKRSWWIHGVMQAGSDLLYPMNRNAKFDKGIIGYSVGFIYKGPKNAKVVKLPKYQDGSYTGALQLDKKSPHFARQWGLPITPPDYTDFCACTMPGGDMILVTPSTNKSGRSK